MCFKITLALREYYRYCGVSANVERRGCGSSQFEFASTNRQKQHELVTPTDGQDADGPQGGKPRSKSDSFGQLSINRLSDNVGGVKKF